jgi:transcription elongation factor GreA
MAEKQVYLTAEGMAKLEDELDILKSVKRREVADRIKQALDFGDISENAEYDQAKNEQAQLEERVVKIENTLANAILIDNKEIDTDTISVGSKVLVKDVEYDEDMEYLIVGSAEADPHEGKISNESPLGDALLGMKKGDTVQVKVPDGHVEYKILNIGV